MQSRLNLQFVLFVYSEHRGIAAEIDYIIQRSQSQFCSHFTQSLVLRRFVGAEQGEV